MNAGRGIIHSEMPVQEHGLLWGFQLWINLPASQKLQTPSYQEFDSNDIPVETRDNTRLNVIAGTTSNGIKGPVKNIPTHPLYLDIHLTPMSDFKEPLPSNANAFVYVYQGEVNIASTINDDVVLKQGTLAVLDEGDGIYLRTRQHGARLLLLAASPLSEPIARGGPFVMNTRAEILQAFEDYEQNRF